MKTLIIIPAYNEEKSILRVYDNIIDYNKKNKSDYDIIVINDGSKDNTEEVLSKNNIPHIKLIQNLGIGGAVQTGYKYAYEHNYDIAVQYDGDGQHNIEYVENIIEPIKNNEASMVIGSRFVKDIDTFKSSAARRLGIKLISFFIKLVTGKKICDTTSGMRAIDKDIIKEFASSYPTEYPEPVSTVHILKLGYKVSEVSVEMNERSEGVSSIRAWKNIYYMINVILSIVLIGLRRTR
ncbi:MAG: glycosyltransferase family 2 protein [Bacilli bacterium]|nr:glycosyltransferase family 2 protein [Bacilli bacterium]